MKTVAGNNPSRVGDVLLTVYGPVLTATIDRPLKRNALSQGVIEGLFAAVDAVTSQELSLLVLRGAGNTFCAGADLDLVRSMLNDPNGMTDYLADLSRVCDQLARGPFVSLAVVSGYALAGGCELLLACDLAVASHSARIGDRHLQNSLLPGAGGSVRLMRAISPARARWLFYTAEMISGQQAEEWGLVSASCPEPELENLVSELVGVIASKSPAALRAMKTMTIAAETMTDTDALAAERQIFLDYFTGSDTVRGALTRFLGREHG